MTICSFLFVAFAAAALPGSEISTAPPEVIRAFRATCAEKAAGAERAGTMTAAGIDGWLFYDSELRHLAAGEFWGGAAAKANRIARPEFADPLPVILDFKAQLDRAGIELILMPVPAKAVCNSGKLAVTFDKEIGRLDSDHRRFYQGLRDKGVHVIDLTPEFLRISREKGSASFCKTDTHWSGKGCIAAAKMLADEVRDRPWLKDVKRIPLASQTKAVAIAGDLAVALKGPAAEKEAISLRFVGVQKEGYLEPLEEDPASPLVLMGDSHNLIFHAGGDMHAEGAGLADQLALELGFAVDLIAVRGSGATPARINLMRSARADANYLKEKRLVVWCFSVREFTESGGWQKVPLTADANDNPRTTVR